MSDLKKGQLVAVRDAEDCEWKLRVYDHASPEGLHFCVGLERGAPPCWWNQVCPAEVVWPYIFLSVEREIAEFLQEDKARLYRQVRWLCERLQAIGDCNGTQECPPSPHHDCRRGSCADCWDLASMDAVKEDTDGSSEEDPALG